MSNEADVILGTGSSWMTIAMLKRIGLFGGPILGLVCYLLLPFQYSTGPGEWVEFTQAGRATLALMVW